MCDRCGDRFYIVNFAMSIKGMSEDKYECSCISETHKLCPECDGGKNQECQFCGGRGWGGIYTISQDDDTCAVCERQGFFECEMCNGIGIVPKVTNN